MTHPRKFPRPRMRPRGMRRGFNLVELLMALAISAALLTATMVALDASFMAYQTTTEVASTHTVGRLAMHRMLTLVRSGVEFAPLPADLRAATTQSNFIDVQLADGTIMGLEWVPEDEALYIVVDDQPYLMLEGVIAQTDADGDPVPPFTLEYERGFRLYRATIDLMIQPDDNLDVEIDGDNTDVIHLVSTAMPRASAFRD